MSPKSNDELRQLKAELIALVERGPKPGREAIQIADALLKTLTDGCKPESRIARLAALLRGQFLSWFGNGPQPDLEAATRQKTAMLGGIGQLVNLVARRGAG